jgi:hypothetical protein
MMLFSIFLAYNERFSIVVEVITVAYDDRLRLFDTSKLSGVLSSKER